jgi:transposase InsO family protein
MTAGDTFKHPTIRINELWQTDFTYFKIIGWGWYYLSTVLDDFSRYILAWKLFTSMTATDVQDTLDMAIAKTGVHPMTQGKIERYHRTMKNIVKLEHYYLPGELERAIAKFVEHYNNHRYHESLDNVTPADMYYGRQRQIKNIRERIKNETLKHRKLVNMKIINHQTTSPNVSLNI